MKKGVLEEPFLDDAANFDALCIALRYIRGVLRRAVSKEEVDKANKALDLIAKTLGVEPAKVRKAP